MISVAQEHLKALGFDPGPVDGVFTAQTAEAIRPIAATALNFVRVAAWLEDAPQATTRRSAFATLAA
jgi:hypothetical protein